MKKQRGRTTVAVGAALVLVAMNLPIFSVTQAQSSPPAKFEFLVGEWEARIPTNRYRMRTEWNREKNQFRGFLTKQGDGSADVGFRMGEHIWTAQPIWEPDLLIEVQKWRSGSGGTSIGVEWRIGEVDIKQSSGNVLVTTTAEFSKVR